MNVWCPEHFKLGDVDVGFPDLEVSFVHIADIISPYQLDHLFG